MFNVAALTFLPAVVAPRVIVVFGRCCADCTRCSIHIAYGWGIAQGGKVLLRGGEGCRRAAGSVKQQLL